MGDTECDLSQQFLGLEAARRPWQAWWLPVKEAHTKKRIGGQVLEHSGP